MQSIVSFPEKSGKTVISGMRRFYEDAFRIDGWVRGGKLTVEGTINNKIAQDILKGSKLGKGENSTLHLFFNKNASSIISDDRAFLNIITRFYLLMIKNKDYFVVKQGLAYNTSLNLRFWIQKS